MFRVHATARRASDPPIDRKIGGRLIHAPLLSLFGRHWYTDTTNHRLFGAIPV
jgi:hypothetical protein